jgi:hypothetical protein
MSRFPVFASVFLLLIADSSAPHNGPGLVRNVAACLTSRPQPEPAGVAATLPPSLRPVTGPPRCATRTRDLSKPTTMPLSARRQRRRESGRGEAELGRPGLRGPRACSWRGRLAKA